MGSLKEEKIVTNYANISFHLFELSANKIGLTETNRFYSEKM